jgi:hypothetical protein
MNHNSSDVDRRFQQLVRRLRNTQIALTVVALALGGAFVVEMRGAPQGDTGAGDHWFEEVRTHRLVVVDEAGTERVVIEEEPAGIGRRGQAAGIVIFDQHGNERGGMVTFDDDSTVIALDAPAGVGAPMRDRLALRVNADGSASVIVLDNGTGIPVRLVADAEGGGGLEMLEYDLENGKVAITRLTSDGQSVREFDLDGK